MRPPAELTDAVPRAGPQDDAAAAGASSGSCTATRRHPTAEAVYAAAAREMPTISLRTVYQTLNDLAEMGEIRTLDARHRLGPVRPERRRRTTTSSATRAAWCDDVYADASASTGAPSTAAHGLRVTGDRDRLPRPARRCAGRDLLAPASPTTPNHLQGDHMTELKGSKTHENLKEAFAGESQANRRYLYFAQKADVEGYPDVAALFRSVAEGETGHAFGHFDFLARSATRRPASRRGHRGQPQVGDRRRDLRVHRDVPGLRQDRPRRGLRPRSPSGSRPSPGPRRPTPDASPRVSRPSA